ncbi:MAG: metalloprotease PmbA [Betaproteobacteria bacterium]|nr:metalloprotease PmbA [Betaproteobacteria bacterium]
MKKNQFDLEHLKKIADYTLDYAKKIGATASEVEVSFGTGKNISVRLGSLETLEINGDKGFTVTLFNGQRKGSSSSSDLSIQSIQDTVDAAFNIARYTAPDPLFGLADKSLIATNMRDLDLHNAWDVSIDHMIDLAKKCEASALNVSTKITNSEGANISSSEGVFVYANSYGFMGGYPTSRHSIGCSVIAEEKSMMQRDYWYSSARHVEDLESVDLVGKLAGTRTLSRLGAKKIRTCHAPVIFEAPIASGFISSLISAISGGNLYRQSSFLLDSLGKKVASGQLTIEEDPFILRGDASSMFDDEGVATRSRLLVDQGTINGYLLSSYSARKLGMQSTGNAGGAHNLIVKTGNQGLNGLIKTMHEGLLVTELLGHGLNMVTGDYSRGASGYWVEDGVIAYPVEEITIAGNMRDMLKQIVEIGNDVYRNGSKHTGSILLETMSIASS